MGGGVVSFVTRSVFFLFQVHNSDVAKWRVCSSCLFRGSIYHSSMKQRVSVDDTRKREKVVVRVSVVCVLWSTSAAGRWVLFIYFLS